VRELVERAWFHLCRVLGRLLRSARYARARVVRQDGMLLVRKRRASYAPVVVWLGGPLMAMLDTGVRVLPQRAWEERERRLYRQLRGTPVRVEADGALLLPFLAGRTLAILLDDRALEEPVRRRAIVLAVVALAGLHHEGFTHGDAMAENVMVDLAADVAHWFDFETMHDARRPAAWRRADDMRALLATCLLRTAAGRVDDTVRLVVDTYADDVVTRLVAASFASVRRRPLVFHLGQAPLSLARFREIARALHACLDDPRVGTPSSSAAPRHAGGLP
jgi:tRNA A-37 threonylcarbamoyl transferase component Bud32